MPCPAHPHLAIAANFSNVQQHRMLCVPNGCCPVHVNTVQLLAPFCFHQKETHFLYYRFIHLKYATADQGSQTGLGSASTRLSDRPGTLSDVVYCHSFWLMGLLKATTETGHALLKAFCICGSHPPAGPCFAKLQAFLLSSSSSTISTAIYCR